MVNDSSFSSKSDYLLNFSFSHKRLSSREDALGLGNSFDLNNSNFNSNSNPNSTFNAMSSNVISETSLETDFILFRKKSLLKRKSMGSLKIFYSEIIDLKLIKSDLSNLQSSIVIVYSKNGYTKHLIRLSSSDSFAVRWFYDELVVRYSLFKSNLKDKKLISNEKEHIHNDKEHIPNEKEHLCNDKDIDIKDEKDNKSSNSTLDDFMDQMNAEISEERKRKISKQMKFDRCSSGEY